MATQIDIVIKGSDRFSAAFETLERALSQSDRAAGQLEHSTAALAQGFRGMAEQAARSGQSARAMTDGLVAQLNQAAETQGETLARMAQQQEEADRSMAERRLALQAEADAQRQAAREASYGAEEQAEARHQAVMSTQRTNTLVLQTKIEIGLLNKRMERYRFFYETLHELALSMGRSMAQTAKNLALAHALIDTYAAANQALASVPYPLNFAAAALVTARGLANVRQIEQTSIAHGGLERVPEDATFLLRRGERVLSPGQNRDLTGFLTQAGAAPAAVHIQQLTIHVLENATAGEALLAMDAQDMRQVVAERILPALDELARLGQRPKFIDNNT